MTLDRERLLAVVNASPARVAAHDKRGWLELFGPGSVIDRSTRS